MLLDSSKPIEVGVYERKLTTAVPACETPN